MVQTTQERNKIMKTITINKWTIGGTIVIALALIGIGGATASSEPKKETRTVTKYKTREVKVPGKTIYELSPTCRDALVKSTQTMSDFNNLVGQIGDAIVEYTKTYDVTALEEALAQQQIVIDGMLAAVKQNVACDPTIGQDVTITE